MDKRETYLMRMNAPDAAARLEAAREAADAVARGELVFPKAERDVNNHIHTTYSFSPYSPTLAVFRAKESGLLTCGIMDHDSVSGAREFVEAGKIFKIYTTVGIECRADMHGTPLEGRQINTPDQKSLAYLAIHSIPLERIDEVTAFFAPRIERRNARNRKMVERINKISEIQLDFDRDVWPISMCADGGSITERHILYALALKLIERFGKGMPILDYLWDQGVVTSEKIMAYLKDENNPYYAYDLLGVLKSELLGKFFIEATDECPHVTEVAKLAKQVGAIFTYAYLGDVGESPTGDKRAQKFEDSYIHLLFETLRDLDFDAVTFMPPRNTAAQIILFKGLCRKFGFMEISGVDINSPRQEFICKKQRHPKFNNLYDSAFALIGNEHAHEHGIPPMFPLRGRRLQSVVREYAALGKTIL